MKVLFLHQHFRTPYQGGAIRSYYLAKELVDRGMTAIVITARNGSKYQNENVDGIDVHYLPIPYHNRFGFFRRIVSFLLFAMKASSLAVRFRDVDICYAMSVPMTVGIAARRLKHRLNIPYMFEVGDLWPDAPIQMGFIKNTLFKQWLYGLEKKIYRDARSVVGLSPSIVKAVEEKTPDVNVHLITNMADTVFFTPEMKTRALERKFDVENKFVVSYVGAIGLANGLDHLVAAARASQDAALKVHFMICGDGALLDGLQKEVRTSALKNFSIIPFQNRDGVKEILNVTDAVFISYKPVPILETGSPNKYFDGLAAGKLIIVNFGGWIREEVERAKCGFYTDPMQPDSFVAGIQQFLKEPARSKEYQQNSRTLAEKKYSRRIQCDRFIRLLETGQTT